jgi:hypothetical protein
MFASPHSVFCVSLYPTLGRLTLRYRFPRLNQKIVELQQQLNTEHRIFKEVMRARRFPRSMTLPVPPIGSEAVFGNAGQRSLQRAREDLRAREGYPIHPPRPQAGFDIYQHEQSLKDRSNQAQHRAEEAPDF